MSESWKIDAFITLNWKAGILHRALAGERAIESFLSPFLQRVSEYCKTLGNESTKQWN